MGDAVIDSIENIHEFCVDNTALTEGSVVYPRWGIDISIVFGGPGVKPAPGLEQKAKLRVVEF